MRVRRKYRSAPRLIRRYIESGSILLISSAWKRERNIMTCGWHMMLSEEDPVLVACFIWDQNHSRGMIRKSRQCVINIPTADMARTVVGIGTTDGPEVDKFAEFGLTPLPARRVRAPLIGECFASYECRLVDTRLINSYSLFVFEVLQAHAVRSPKYPATLHYRGEGVFMTSGPSRKLFNP
jgi:flavin reductase (DIM6/NTAB) family NADH-FMN oxidoreductase RutF